ncbi:MAG: leucine-rich repeat domain-containing protein [Sphingobacteriales bacterium]|nr:MAG: leucine-rich repeat domain-containing protein [Sphingobacteriales bacterium]
MKILGVLLLVLNCFVFTELSAQVNIDAEVKKEFKDLSEALKNPAQVYRLNLSNQKVSIPDSVWEKFSNLEYLSLRNDHLKAIPAGIGNLGRLRVLDLSGNDFTYLPASFKNLSNLEELYLNDDKYFNLEQNLPLLGSMSGLRSLHLENDGLKRIPKNIGMLNQVESIFLNNNKFSQPPLELKKLPNLKFLDLQGNRLRYSRNEVQSQFFGIQVNF